jgi:hypothetical protein
MLQTPEAKPPKMNYVSRGAAISLSDKFILIYFYFLYKKGCYNAPRYVEYVQSAHAHINMQHGGGSEPEQLR